MSTDSKNPANPYALGYEDMERGRYMIVFDRATGQKKRYIVLATPFIQPTDTPTSSLADVNEADRTVVQVLDKNNEIQLEALSYVGVIPHVNGGDPYWNMRYFTVDVSNEGRLPQPDQQELLRDALGEYDVSYLWRHSDR